MPALTAARSATPPETAAGRPALPRRATVASVCLHALLLTAVARLVLPALHPPAPEWAIPLAFAPPAPAPQPAAPLAEAAAGIAAAALPPPRGVTEIIALRAPPRMHAAAATPRHVAQSPSSPAPRAAPQAATPALARAASLEPDTAWLASFTGRVQAAVQAAAVYPPAARAQHREGRVRIRFDYADGAASAPEVLVSSSQAMLDRAALRAVQSAAYPAVPASFVRARLQLVVWVDFRMVPES